MKKFIFSSLTILSLLCPIFLCGCGSEMKTLAKNLDDTVTNLIYTVSSLDWADTNTLESLSSDTNIMGIDYTTNTLENKNLETQIQYPINNQENGINNTTYTPNALNQYNGNATQNLNSCPNGNCSNNYYQNRINNYSTDLAQNFDADMDKAQAEVMPYNKDEYYNSIRNRGYNNSLNRIRQSSNKKLSGGKQNRTSLTKETKSKLPNTSIASNSQNNTQNQTSQINNITSNNQVMMAVNYSTSAIKENLNQIQEKIKELVDKRANIILYVNALYNKNINLSKDNITAINAYINIIKDNTSYLSSNKGMVNNQLNQARNIRQNDAYSPLINAYIIRTNEAIQTRATKLDACLLAIDSIIDILDSNAGEESIANNINNNSNNNKSNLEQQEMSEIEQTEINTEKLSMENKNANIDTNMLNNGYNIEENTNNGEINNKNTPDYCNNDNCNNIEDIKRDTKENICEDCTGISPSNQSLEQNSNVDKLKENNKQEEKTFIDEKYNENTLPIIEKTQQPIIDSESKTPILNSDIIKGVPSL